MNRKRLLVGLQIGTGLILAGLGHLYVAFLRDVYPLDGYVLYALALILLWRGWRTIRRAPDPVWAALLDSLHAAWRVMAYPFPRWGTSERNLLLVWWFGRGAAAPIMLNVLAAMLIVWLPSGALAWLTLWFV